MFGSNLLKRVTTKLTRGTKRKRDELRHKNSSTYLDVIAEDGDSGDDIQIKRKKRSRAVSLRPLLYLICCPSHSILFDSSVIWNHCHLFLFSFSLVLAQPPSLSEEETANNPCRWTFVSLFIFAFD